MKRLVTLLAAVCLTAVPVTVMAVETDYNPGTYTGSAQGMDSEVTVSITVDENSITDVEIDVSGETPGIGAEIGDTVSEQI